MLVGKPEEKKQRGKSKHIWEDNIKNRNKYGVRMYTGLN
jgi:hypothetical protein